MLIIEAFQQLRSRRKGAAAVVAPVHQTNAADKENLIVDAVGGLTAAVGGTRNNNKLSSGSSCSTNSLASNGSVKKSYSAEFTSVCDTIQDEEFDKLVVIPSSGVDQREWMASHLLAFFHHVNALYGSVSELCTVDTCPVMNGPGNVQIPWVDEKGKKCKYAAPQYVDCVMSFVEKIVRSEDSFPTKFGHYFPQNFDSTVKKLCRLLYHVLAHLHVAHWRQLAALNISSQAQAVGRHFYAFSRHYNMLDSKEASSLSDLLNECRAASKGSGCVEEDEIKRLSVSSSSDCLNNQQQQQAKLAALQTSSIDVTKSSLDDSTDIADSS